MARAKLLGGELLLVAPDVWDVTSFFGERAGVVLPGASSPWLIPPLQVAHA
jgi:hypothetical protein